MTALLLELTSSQRMAMKSVLVEYLRIPGAVEVFVDCSQSPTVETTPAELLKLLDTAKPDPFAGERQELLTEITVLQRKLAEKQGELNKARGRR